MDQVETNLLSRCPSVTRRLLTADEYHRMGDAGILTEEDRVELIEGELVAMAPIGTEHVATSNSLTRLLVLAVGDRGIVSVGNPVRLNRYNEPQPDFTVLRPRSDYRGRLPQPEDTLLAVEVAASSLDYDRGVKLALYARSGIPEVWIVNLAAHEVEIYRSPSGDSYGQCRRAGLSDSLPIQAIPEAVIPVANILS